MSLIIPVAPGLQEKYIELIVYVGKSRRDESP